MRTNKLLIFGGLAFIIFVFLSVKGGYLSFGGKDNPQFATKITTATTQSSLIGQQAPDFNLTTLDKNTFKLSDKKGKTVILFGMAGWCSTCIPEGRNLTKILKEYSDKGVEIIGVAFTKGDNDDFLKEYKKVGGIDIPIALDTDNVATKYNLTRLETTYIINKDGVIIYKDEQITSYEDYKKELDKII